MEICQSWFGLHHIEHNAGDLTYTRYYATGYSKRFIFESSGKWQWASASGFIYNNYERLLIYLISAKKKIESVFSHVEDQRVVQCINALRAQPQSI